MKVFFDTEFTGLHKNTSLISIGLVAENHRQAFYAELTDYDKDQVTKWIQSNVIDKLRNGKSCRNVNLNYTVGTKTEVAESLRYWFSKLGEDIELVSDVCHFDMVLLTDLFGTAFDLPKNVSPVCYDLNQDIARYFNISQTEAFNVSREAILRNNDLDMRGKFNKHNALYDAMVIKRIYNLINKNKRRKKKIWQSQSHQI